jgi:hypothetical protein
MGVKSSNSPACQEFIIRKVSKLSVAFYDTPESLFEALTKTVLFLELTESEVNEMVNEAIFTIRKTRITIADVINGREKNKKNESERVG